ncbi:MAG: cysteine--tRNA ligase [Nitrospirota bacterium]|nr:MAG: cysteine--tRNA ligase [Nitrospirota bacterium]
MGIFKDIKRDYRAVFAMDPAVRGALEVITSYPGFHAVLSYRFLHLLWRLRVPLFPRMLSHLVRFLTGIEIHPAAKIQGGLFIDHGMGVVIGETAEVGENCLIYQGATLGGTGKDKGKRHPTVGNNVVIGTGAKVLGAIRIGDYVKIGANAVVLNPVPDHSIVVGVPGRVIKRKVLRLHEEGVVEALDHIHMPDPVEEKFHQLEAHIARLEQKIGKLEGREDRMRIYNTLTGKKEDFIPVNEGSVGMYACGVTVYDNCHVGHARSAIVFDVIKSYLNYRGFKVSYVRNFTDIDDKIINRAKEEGISWDEVAQKYTEEYYADMDALGVSRADLEPKATDHIPEMIEIIVDLIEKGYAYDVDGDVFFEVSKFDGYGKLSKRDMKDMMAGARVDVDERKKSPMDFALWKSSKEGEPSWESPWGPGRPGWHIECSAMSKKHLGESFDIHGGGADLIFPHHENEIAQSEAYTGKDFAKYWVHNGFITIDKEKMSKSLGNFFTIKEILDKFDPEVLRVFLLSTHYRSPIEFSDMILRETEALLDRFYSTLMRIDDFISKNSSGSGQTGETETFKKVLERFEDRFREAMDDDFNTALAIGHIYEVIREVNRYIDSKPSGDDATELLNDAVGALRVATEVLNVFNRTPKEWYVALMRSHGIPLTEDDIDNKIEMRRDARSRKDWDQADIIRDELLRSGVILEDRPDKTVWKIKIGN